MIGFHGCDESVRNQLVTNPDFVKISKESFDWLGHDFYLWENNYERALQWAEDKKRRGKLEKPSVLGVVYQLDYCLGFSDSMYIRLIGFYYNMMKEDLLQKQNVLPNS
jgi:hypothetical protein